MATATRKSLIESVKVSEFEVRLVRDASRKRQTSVTSPEDVAEILKPLCTFDREQFFSIYLNSRHECIGVELVSIGSVNATVVHPREVFKGAMLKNAVAIVVAHTHPSGDTEPSSEDMDITRRLKAAGDVLGIDLLDHVIVTQGGYLSMRSRGMMPTKKNS